MNDTRKSRIIFTISPFIPSLKLNILLMEEILHQLIGNLSHLQGFIHPRWLFGISSINSSTWKWMVERRSGFLFWGPASWQVWNVRWIQRKVIICCATPPSAHKMLDDGILGINQKTYKKVGPTKVWCKMSKVFFTLVKIFLRKCLLPTQVHFMHCFVHPEEF